MSQAPEKNVHEKTTPTKLVEKEKKELVKARVEIKVQAKLPWTLERAKKHARHYPSEGVWASSHPSSYKSAIAHGWLKECLTLQTEGAKILRPEFGKPAKPGSHGPLKKAA